MPKKSLNAKYSFNIEEIGRVAINCYTGSYINMLESSGIIERESTLWLAGNGFSLTSGEDEYGIPELRFNLFSVIDNYLNRVGLNINKVYHTDIDDFFDNSKYAKGRVIWLNSEYLEYADIYRLNRGYLHSVYVERESKALETLDIIDSLVVGTPNMACKTKIDRDQLTKAMENRIGDEFSLYYGYHEEIECTETYKPLTNEELLNALREQAMESHVSVENIVLWKSNLFNVIERENTTGRSEVLRKIVDNINTLYVIPNRMLLIDIIDRLKVNISGEGMIRSYHEELIKSWRMLSSTALRFSMHYDESAIDRLNHRFNEVCESEIKFWDRLRACTERYS